MAHLSWQELIMTYPGFTISMMLMGFGIAMVIALWGMVLYTTHQSEQALRKMEADDADTVD